LLTRVLAHSLTYLLNLSFSPSLNLLHVQSHEEKRERVSSADARTRRMQQIVEKYEREAQLKSRLLLSQHVSAASGAAAVAAAAHPTEQALAHAREFLIFS
jgi:hypothetical protein